MNTDYRDIRSKIDEEPQWFDEFAVPRYRKFSPRMIADIYADECALVLIKCQACGHEFKVAFSHDKMDEVKYMMMFGKDKKMPTIADRIRTKTLFYGDPPNIECCPAGNTMSSDSIKVLGFWERHTNIFQWKRIKELEVDLSTEV